MKERINACSEEQRKKRQKERKVKKKKKIKKKKKKERKESEVKSCGWWVPQCVYCHHNSVFMT